MGIATKIAGNNHGECRVEAKSCLNCWKVKIEELVCTAILPVEFYLDDNREVGIPVKQYTIRLAKTSFAHLLKPGLGEKVKSAKVSGLQCPVNATVVGDASVSSSVGGFGPKVCSYPVVWP